MPATRPVLFFFMGLIASGKSTLAQAFARSRGLAVYNSDLVRKELAGNPHRRKSAAVFAGGIYTPEFSRRTYDELQHLAAAELRLGHSVVLDASFHKEEERRRLVDFCHANDYAYYCILCRVSEQETRRRLEIRAHDPEAVSDGTWEVYQQQCQVFEYPNDIDPACFLEIVTDRPVNELLTRVTTSLTFPGFCL